MKQTETPAFRRWFGSSVVVDDAGIPMVVYHGTVNDFNVFDSSKVTYSMWNGFGNWFTTDRKYAEVFSKGIKKVGRVIEAYLSIQSPLVYDGDDKDNGFNRMIKEFEEVTGKKTYEATPEDAATFREYIQSLGFDGVLIFQWTGDSKLSGGNPVDIYIALESNQIKSATENRGTFDSGDPDIRNPKRKIKHGLKKNPLAYPPQDITLSHERTPANIDIAAEKALWETAAFKKWFEESKVRDLAKRPMVVYHGTCSAGFTKFDPTKTQEMGFHFGTPSQAKDFLKGCGTFRGRSAGVYPVYLSIQNPLFTPDAFSEDPVYFIEWLEDTNHIHNWFPDESDSYYRSMGKLRDQLAESRMLPGREGYDVRKPLYKAIWGLLRKVVMRKGYDGIRYKNENEGNTFDASNIAWIAFSPAQVKSATENRGTFNRRDPDLRNPRRSMIRNKLSRIIEPGDRILDYDRAQGEDLYRLWDMVHTDMALSPEALVEIEGMLDDDGVLVIQSGEEPAGLRDHFRRVTRYNGMLLVQGPMNPEEARINTEKLRRDLE